MSQEELREEMLTHRQQMHDQHSPFITGVAALGVAFFAVSWTAKEMGYQGTGDMLRDGWKKVVTVAAKMTKPEENISKAFAPK